MMRELFFRDLGFELTSKVVSIFERIIKDKRDLKTLKELQNAVDEFKVNIALKRFSILYDKYSDMIVDDNDSSILKTFEIMVSLL